MPDKVEQLKLAVFVSGRGSNLAAILESEILKGIAEVILVVSDKSECKAFEIARNYKINYVSVCTGKKEGFLNYDELSELLKENCVNLIVLAGFLKMIPPELIKEYPERMINIHPALLPFFGGKGMFGFNVHKAVFESGMKVSGATVHFVNERYDEGLIIAQSAVDISNTVKAEEIASRVLEAEHKLLPKVIYDFALGKIKIINNRVFTN